MKIYLWNKGQWDLFDSADSGFKKELADRKIVIFDWAEIGYSATIGDWAKIGDGATIGDGAEIGDRAKIGDGATIGDGAKIGYSATIGDGAKIGYSATIGDWAKIGDGATIGDGAEIGDRATIGDGATIGKVDAFSELYIFMQTGVVIKDGKGIFYKAVQDDLTDFYSGKYQYKKGKGDKRDLKKDQSVNCGEGWHWTGLWGAVGFLAEKQNKGKIISAEIEMKDILSVYNKVRVKAFKNVQIVKMEGLIK
jgi:UDP-3-O-[3-hydroxymyristoyl] glucosamine N-acyltransferase